MPKVTNRLPKYRKHASGRAVVRINGQDHYLGPYGTKASRTEYDRAIGSGRRTGAAAPHPHGRERPVRRGSPGRVLEAPRFTTGTRRHRHE